MTNSNNAPLDNPIGAEPDGMELQQPGMRLSLGKFRELTRDLPDEASVSITRWCEAGDPCIITLNVSGKGWSKYILQDEYIPARDRDDDDDDEDA